VTRAGLGAVAILCLAGWAVADAAPSDRAKPEVEELAAAREEGILRVSYRVEGAWSPEAEERVQSGIPVVFRHRVDVSTARWMPLVPDRVLSRTLVETRVQYDSLTRRYDLFRRIEMKPRGSGQEPVTEESRKLTDSVEEARDWMIRMESVPVHEPELKNPDKKLRLEVRVVFGRDYVLWVFPSSLSVSTETVLER
jgi:hypothetical protein